jgi:hypothetical protein
MPKRLRIVAQRLSVMPVMREKFLTQGGPAQPTFAKTAQTGRVASAGRDGWRWLFIAAALFGASVFWFAPHLPMVDLPQHAAQIALLRDLLRHDSPWADLFSINLATPYLIGYGLALPLSFFMPVGAAIQTLLSIAYLGFVFMCVKISRGLGADPRMDWLYLPGFFGFSYLHGLYTFLVAAPICLGFMHLGFGYAERRSLRRALAIVAAGAALLVSHGLAFALGWGIGGAALLLRVRRLRELFIAALPYMVLAAGGALYFYLGRKLDAAIINDKLPGYFGATPLVRLRQALFFPFSYYYQASSHALYAPAAAVMLIAPWLLGLRLAGWRSLAWAPFAAVCMIFFFVPTFANNTALLYERFSLFLLPVFAWIFRASMPMRSLRSTLAQALLAITCLALLGWDAARVWRFGQETRGIDAIIKSLEPGQRALGLIFDRGSPGADDYLSYMHYVAWYQAEKGGLTDFNFAWFTPQIVRFRPEHRPAVRIGFEDKPEQFDWHRHRGADYRYFFVRADSDHSAQLFRDAECMPSVAASAGKWTVYERCAGNGSR